MKKILMSVVAVLLAVTLIPLNASAFLGKTNVVVDGKPLSGKAVTKNDVNFVPFRELFDELGLSIQYNSKTKQVTGTSSSLKVTFTVGSKTAYVNGNKKALQAAPFVQNGSVYVPLRIVGEATGSKVVYLKDVQVVLVNSSEFKGLVYDSTYGSLNITTDGKLEVDNLLVLDEFLKFSQEENIVFFKELSKDDGTPKPSVSLRPDTEVVPAD
ncbi:copper amine oxidase N-terminal domain-containing protein [Paenibacillus motobuensis]|uniref:copper amine oxidase N-terminal domain-containing protein n=1 Tax=Paenibacillus TaxID=44249 RepID=UPI00203D3BF0|nr:MULTISPECIES: copper amine oxidase N-terminal domain-containing protein [Paenibacillus]MCM3039749.1 copper amine oxidase N-terminal domain-containing protein [Paenibacillus lutimineralis]MCM3646853.1 copper amine oxidase N-terminal domain-containing protein [Paenibacillus motobuensis]